MMYKYCGMTHIYYAPVKFLIFGWEFGLWAVSKISKKESMDESNMFKVNFIKEMF